MDPLYHSFIFYVKEPSVSSTSEKEVGAPNKGILKQRATLLRKSKSTSNIISLNIRSAQVILFLNF